MLIALAFVNAKVERQWCWKDKAQNGKVGSGKVIFSSTEMEGSSPGSISRKCSAECYKLPNCRSYSFYFGDTEIWHECKVFDSMEVKDEPDREAVWKWVTVPCPYGPSLGSNGKKSSKKSKKTSNKE